ncbi:hypothetical protein KGM_213422 [Danaus plexippus plexippus]|uniref:PiggyBac transposable element-derived protein domain-containing protein n=1 Tax=Danaus plexippus plexippus TaxID=278856 RepID=A0A212EQW3_DANPL|nr:hypothetical protein KGM_213422 [Danaus plexippus plexippus]
MIDEGPQDLVQDEDPPLVEHAVEKMDEADPPLILDNTSSTLPNSNSVSNRQRDITISVEQGLSDDEQMCATKMSHYMKQYLSNKPHKWGFKLFLLCSIYGFAHKFEVYAGSEKHTILPEDPDFEANRQCGGETTENDKKTIMKRDIPRGHFVETVRSVDSVDLDMAIINSWLMYKKLNNSVNNSEKLLPLCSFRLEVANTLCILGGPFSNGKRGRPSSNSLEVELQLKRKRGPAQPVSPKDVRLDCIGHWQVFGDKARYISIKSYKRNSLIYLILTNDREEEKNMREERKMELGGYISIIFSDIVQMPDEEHWVKMLDSTSERRLPLNLIEKTVPIKSKSFYRADRSSCRRLEAARLRPVSGQGLAGAAAALIRHQGCKRSPQRPVCIHRRSRSQLRGPTPRKANLDPYTWRARDDLGV